MIIIIWRKCNIIRIIDALVSDNHLLVFSFLKTTFTKTPTNRFCNCNEKTFDAARFLTDAANLLKKKLPKMGK